MDIDEVDEKKEIIFILPYLNVNTTSAERFKSFINSFNNQFKVKVVVIDYRLKKSFFNGLSYLKEDSFFKDQINVFPEFNFIQKCAFKFLNKGNSIVWRFFQLIHLVIYKTDVFYPGNIDLFKSSSKGFVFSSGSHFSFFSVAEKLAKNLDYKLILDYRDPWTFGYTAIDGLSLVQEVKKNFGRKKEELLLSKAYYITTVSESLKSFFPLKYQAKLIVVENGSNYEQTQIIDLINLRPTVFNIIYLGTVYNDQLKDERFFQALSYFILKNNTKVDSFTLCFLGSSKNEHLIKILTKYNLLSYSKITDRLSNDEMLRFLLNASMFLHLKYGDRTKVITSKQADYLTFRKPILLPISDNGDIAESIIKHKAGYVCENESQIMETLEILWGKFIKGENLFINQPREFIESISRKKIAEDFVKLLTEN